MKRLLWAVGLLSLVSAGIGCRSVYVAPQERFLENRWADFRDIFGLGAGATFENEFTLVPSAGSPLPWDIPLPIGAFVDLPLGMGLGARTFEGPAMECEARSGGVYEHEVRYRVGLLHRQCRQVKQTGGDQNCYKRGEPVGWQRRMDDAFLRRKPEVPAKNYRHVDEGREWRTFDMWRGWHHWLWTGVEVAIAEPFLLKTGVTLRLGLDFSEPMDFLLGWAMIDFRQDDVRPTDFSLAGGRAPRPSKPAPKQAGSQGGKASSSIDWSAW